MFENLLPDPISISAPSSDRLIVLSVPLLAADLFLFHFGAVALFGVIGVSIEIIGALFIAVPDIQSLRDYTRPGRLRQTYRELQGYQLHDNVQVVGTKTIDQNGVLELIDLIYSNDMRGVPLIKISDEREKIEYIEYAENAPITVKEALKDAPLKDVDDLAPFVSLGKERGEIVATIPYFYAIRFIENELNQQEGGFVRFGVLLLAIGLTQQLLAYSIQIA